MGVEELRTAFRAPITVHGSEGKTLMMRPLSSGQMLKLRTWVIQKPFRDCLEMMKGQELDVKIRTSLLRTAMKEGKLIDSQIMQGNGQSLMMNFISVEGVRFLVKTMTAKDHPTLTDSEINAFVDEENAAEVVLQMAPILNPGGNGSDPTKESSTIQNSAGARTDRKRSARSSKRSKNSSSK